jgi:ATP-dependent RNA helicase RhlE
MLVLDEADRLLDAGFADELARLRRCCRRSARACCSRPPSRLPCSAGATLLHDPVRVDVDATPRPMRRSSSQRAIEVDAAAHAAAAPPARRQRTGARAGVRGHALRLPSMWPTSCAGRASAAAALHGDLSQGARSRCWPDFKAAPARAGGHRPGGTRRAHRRLPVVVNHDLPRSPWTTCTASAARARRRAAGLAVSFVSAAERAHFRLIEKRQGSRAARAGARLRARGGRVPAPDPNGGIKGRRKSKKDKLNQWHFGMKAHIAVDAHSGLVHTVTTTAANESDVEQVAEPKGATQLWLPVPDVDTDWQRTVDNSWAGNASTAALVASDPRAACACCMPSSGRRDRRPRSR